MKLLRKIWNRIRGLFIRRPPSTEQIVLEEKATLKDNISLEEIYKQIENSNDEKETEILIKKIAKHNTAETIIEFVEGDTNSFNETSRNKKKLFELHELRGELQYLEENRARLDFTKSKIVLVEYQDTSSIDRRIEHLSTLYNKDIVNEEIVLSKNSIRLFEKSYKEFDRLLNEKSTLKRHRNRVIEGDRQEELYKNHIRQKLNLLEALLDQNKCPEAKSLIGNLTQTIKPIYQKELLRLNKANERLQAKELQDLTEQQEAILKKLAEEAQRLKDLENKRLEDLRVAAQNKERQLRLLKEKENAKYEKLNSLLRKKSNWVEFQKVLELNDITTLYHFTDIANLKSIKENGGLYSWHYSDSNGITVSYYGGSTLSRVLDRRYDLQDYVRVSFCSDHPMKFRLFQEGRKLILLQVDLEVIYWNNTAFSNINATDSDHQHGAMLEDFERIKFEATKRNYVEKEDPDFKYHQAEVLVKTWIPLKFIKNIDDF